ncbi:SGNH/GDSL hydrolase family protein [Chryseobacterium indologenes]|uniref:SGNH/GDSL hydrolase family protein n=1 Tax=Chryseobacterium TaxID=59732 RepID=UPI001626ABE9|nr:MULTISPECIES: SGNH/GDSL hydrolase family protein [Chryseobacterium]MDM1556967.1 capsular biosynthesis protein [Chryseobacterium indologenes]WET48943.1 SGNH/GDSL hydrolase family protein [Chryseobacterium indologenes]
MKVFVFLTFSLFACTFVNAQNAIDFANLTKYKDENTSILSSKKKVDVVFMGNSITEGWVKSHPEFFSENNYIGRGISGQTTSQMLLRFQNDVIALRPKLVIINAGTNDIAQNTGIYDPDFTFNNIKAMADIAQYNGIKVIIASVLPAAAFPWRKEITDVPQKVDAMNNRLKQYASNNKLIFVDYNTVMRDTKGGMREGLSKDGIHPVVSGYAIMEPIIKNAINKTLGKK